MMLRLILTLMLAAAPALALDEVRLPSGRSYLIEMPPGVANPPLILALHGGGGNPAQFARTTDLTSAARAAGLAVAFPAGSSRGGPFLTWNAGHCCAYAAAAGIDDVAFLDEVVADAARRFGTGRRVGVTGMSNGAMMALAYASRRPATVAGAVSVAGVLDLKRFPPTALMPVLHIHGLADDRVPFAGGRGERTAGNADYPPVEAMMQALLEMAGQELTRTEAVLDLEDDGKRVLETLWTDAQGRPFLRLLAVEGGGHAWPGSLRAERQRGTRDIDASAEAVAFLALWLRS